MQWGERSNCQVATLSITKYVTFSLCKLSLIFMSMCWQYEELSNCLVAILTDDALHTQNEIFAICYLFVYVCLFSIDLYTTPTYLYTSVCNFRKKCCSCISLESPSFTVFLSPVTHYLV